MAINEYHIMNAMMHIHSSSPVQPVRGIHPRIAQECIDRGLLKRDVKGLLHITPEGTKLAETGKSKISFKEIDKREVERRLNSPISGQTKSQPIKNLAPALLYITDNGPTRAGHGVSPNEMYKCLLYGWVKEYDNGVYHLTEKGIEELKNEMKRVAAIPTILDPMYIMAPRNEKRMSWKEQAKMVEELKRVAKEANVTITTAEQKVLPSDPHAHVLEQLLSVANEGPLLTGDTIPHEAAQKCADMGWIQRNEDGNFVISTRVRDLLVDYVSRVIEKVLKKERTTE